MLKYFAGLNFDKISVLVFCSMGFFILACVGYDHVQQVDEDAWKAQVQKMTDAQNQLTDLKEQQLPVRHEEAVVIE